MEKKSGASMANKINATAYEKWQEIEGIPVAKGFFIEDLKTVPLAKWERKEGLGAFINLEGAEQQDDAYLCEVPPASSLKPQKHLFEEVIFILSGQGATTIWNGGGQKQTFEWQEGSLFSPPINTWHQHFNGRSDKAVRYLAVTSAPLMINLFRNKDFIFNNSYKFLERYSGEGDYFSGKGKSFPWRTWESNFISDVKSFPLQDYRERGAGGKNIRFQLASNTMIAHVSEFPVGTYKKAHRHGSDAHVILLKGKGYSLLWPEGEPRKKVDWREGSMFVPPNMWFHQHFNTGQEPASYLAIHWGDRRSPHGGLGGMPRGHVDLKSGGNQIEYEDEDPEIRKLFESELAKEGVTLRMPVVGKKSRF